MTFLLRRAMAELEKLSAAEQDAVAAWLLEELADPSSWTSHFALVGPADRDTLAQEIRGQFTDWWSRPDQPHDDRSETGPNSELESQPKPHCQDDLE